MPEANNSIITAEKNIKKKQKNISQKWLKFNIITGFVWSHFFFGNFIFFEFHYVLNFPSTERVLSDICLKCIVDVFVYIFNDINT